MAGIHEHDAPGKRADGLMRGRNHRDEILRDERKILRGFGRNSFRKIRREGGTPVGIFILQPDCGFFLRARDHSTQKKCAGNDADETTQHGLIFPRF